MALLFMDGFDHYGNGSDPALMGKWASSLNFAAYTALARTGLASCRFLSNGEGFTKPLPAVGGFVVGFALNSASAVTNADILQIREGTTVHLAVGITIGGLLTVKLGSTVLQTGTRVFNLNNWYHIEFKGTIHDTTGSYELRIDGAVELTATNVDTRNAGTTGQWDRIRVGAPNAAGSGYIDDLYVCDTSSAIRNNFLGACKIETLMPQTDAVAAGIDAGLTPSTGTDHGALVDEVPPNTTDYNSSPTVNATDLYQYPNMALTGSILGLQVNMYAAKSDATARTICSMVRTTFSQEGPAVSPGTTFGYLTDIRPINHGTASDWTIADVNAVQVGMRVKS